MATSSRMETFEPSLSSKSLKGRGGKNIILSYYLWSVPGAREGDGKTKEQVISDRDLSTPCVWKTVGVFPLFLLQSAGSLKRYDSDDDGECRDCGAVRSCRRCHGL